MKMKCKALKSFPHDELGQVKKGDEFEATAAQLSGVKAFVEVYETKVVREEPNTKAKPAARPATKKAD